MAPKAPIKPDFGKPLNPNFYKTKHQQEGEKNFQKVTKPPAVKKSNKKGK